MSTITDSDVDKQGSFLIYPSNVISTDFSNVKILGITGWELVQFINPAQAHANVYQALPEGTPNDYRAYKYVTVRLGNGDVTAVGMPWIIPESVQISSNTDIMITIHGKGSDDIPLLKQVLAVQGFANNEIKIKPL